MSTDNEREKLIFIDLDSIANAYNASQHHTPGYGDYVRPSVQADIAFEQIKDSLQREVEQIEHRSSKGYFSELMLLVKKPNATKWSRLRSLKVEDFSGPDEATKRQKCLKALKEQQNDWSNNGQKEYRMSLYKIVSSSDEQERKYA